jgi:hypothetical protein
MITHKKGKTLSSSCFAYIQYDLAFYWNHTPLCWNMYMKTWQNWNLHRSLQIISSQGISSNDPDADKSTKFLIAYFEVIKLGCNNNNNQAFYSQASWSRLEMKPHEEKKCTKQEWKRRGKQRAIKKTKSKDNKTLSQKKRKRGRGKKLDKRQ